MYNGLLARRLWPIPRLNCDRDLKRTALTVSTLAGFLTPFMGSAVNVALPDIAAEFSLKAVTLSWVATAYLLAAAVFLVPLGRLADIVGRKKIFLVGVSLFTIASLLAAAAPRPRPSSRPGPCRAWAAR